MKYDAEEPGLSPKDECTVTIIIFEHRCREWLADANEISEGYGIIYYITQIADRARPVD